jgi:hypothetical protein
MFRRILSSIVSAVIGLTPVMASAETSYQFRYRMPIADVPAVPPDDPDFGAGNDIQAWFVAPVGHPFLKEIPVATKDVRDWVKDSGGLPSGIDVEAASGVIAGEAERVEKTDTTWYGIGPAGTRIARAQMHFSTFQPVGQVTEVNWYTHTGEYFYAQIPAPSGIDVLRWEPIVDNPAGMTTRNGAFEGRPPASGTFAVAWRGFDYLNREVAFTYGEFLVQDGPVIERIADQVVDKGLSQTFNVLPQVKHRIGAVSYKLLPVAARPSGLTFKSSNGSITGVYEDFDTTAQFALEARDSGSGKTSVSNVFTLTTLPESLELSSMPDLHGTVGTWFQRRIPGGSDNVHFDLVAGQLPAGITLTNVATANGVVGEISGTPTQIESQAGLQISASGQNVTPITSNPFKFAIHSESLSVDLAPVHVRVNTTFQSAAPVVTHGAEPPYTYTSAAVLPAGIAFNPSDGTFASAGLAQAGSYDQNLNVTNAGGQKVSGTQMLRVYNNLTLAYPARTDGTRLSNVSISPIITQDSIRDPAKYTLVQGQLPDFLKFDASTGAIDGKPERMGQIGSYGSFVVSLTDGFNEPPVSSNPFTIEIKDRPGLEISQVTAQAQRWVYNSPLIVSAANVYDGVTFAVLDRGNLPSTLSVDEAGRLVGSTSDPVGTVYSFKVGAVDGVGYSDDLAVSVMVIEPKDIGSIDGGLDRTFTWTVDRDFIGFSLPRVANTFGEVTYTLGSSPFPLQVDQATLALTGKSPDVGTYTVTYTVEDETGRPPVTGTITFVIQPAMEVQQADVTVNRGMPVTVAPTRTNGVADFKWEILSGQLPATGTFAPMTFDRNTGQISGKPREEGSFQITLRVTDKTGQQKDVSFTLTVAPPLPFKFTYGEGWMTYGAGSAVWPTFENKSEAIEWTITGALPGGVNFLTTPTESGVFWGYPNEDGIFENIVVRGKDTGTGEVWTETVTLKVRRAGNVGMSGANEKIRAARQETISLGASNVTEPVKYELVDNAYPSNASIDPATGALTAQFAEPGKYMLNVKATDLFDRTASVPVALDVVDRIEVEAPARTTMKQFTPGTVPFTVKNLIGTATYALDGTSTALPPQFRVQSGSIQATPDAAGQLSGIVVAVIDSHDNMMDTTDAFTIDVAARDALELTAADYEQQQYKAVAFAPSVKNAIGAVTYTLTGPVLPAGLTFDPATGAISGITDDTFEGTLSLQAVDAKGGQLGTDAKTFVLKIGKRDKPEITTNASQAVFYDYDYALTLGSAKLLGTVSWRLVSGTLPSGITFDAATGTFHGKAGGIGSFGPVVVEITDTYKNVPTTNTKSFTFGVVQDGSPIDLTVPVEAGFRVGQSFQAPLPSASNTVGDLTWSASGLAGTGLAIDPKTGLISGTPTWTGEKSVTFTVADTTGRTASKTMKLVVKAALEIDFQTASTLTYNYSFAGTTLNSQGGVRPSVKQPEGVNSYGTEVWSVSPAGSLPHGLTFNASTGKFDGAPQQLGTFGPFSLTLKDSLPGPATFGNVYLDVVMNDDPIDLAVPSYTTKIGYAIRTPAPDYNNNVGDITFFPENNDLAGTNLVLNSDTGVLTGSFATPQDRDINIAVNDEYTTRVTSKPMSLVVLPLLTLTGPQTAPIEAQAPMNPVAVTAANVAGTLKWKDLDPAQKALLPEGVTFDTNSGRFVGQADKIGTYGPFAVSAVDTFHGFTDTGISNQIVLDVRAGAKYLRLDSSALADGTKRIASYSHDFMASNLEAIGIDETDLSWSWVAEQGSKLPAGLTLGAKSGAISGTPTESGEFEFVVTVTDGDKTSSSPFKLTVNLPVIGLDHQGGTLPAGEGAVAYSVDMKSLLTVTNIPKSEVKWATDTAVTVDPNPAAKEFAGLPEGLTLDANTGVLSGKPMAVGKFRFGVTVSWDEVHPATEHADQRREYLLVVTGVGYTYYRLNDSVTPAGNTWPGVYWGELRLFDQTGVNVATTANIKVESLISSPNVFNNPADSNAPRVFDGDQRTGMIFGPDATGVRYIGVKFKIPVQISSAYVSLAKPVLTSDYNWVATYFPAVPVNFKIEASLDGLTWVTLQTASFTGQGGGLNRTQWDATYQLPN